MTVRNVDFYMFLFKKIDCIYYVNILQIVCFTLSLFIVDSFEKYLR